MSFCWSWALTKIYQSNKIIVKKVCLLQVCNCFVSIALRKTNLAFFWCRLIRKNIFLCCEITATKRYRALGAQSVPLFGIVNASFLHFLMLGHTLEVSGFGWKKEENSLQYITPCLFFWKSSSTKLCSLHHTLETSTIFLKMYGMYSWSKGADWELAQTLKIWSNRIAQVYQFRSKNYKLRLRPNTPSSHVVSWLTQFWAGLKQSRQVFSWPKVSTWVGLGSFVGWWAYLLPIHKMLTFLYFPLENTMT